MHDMIGCCPTDYIHMLYLEITRRILLLWRSFSASGRELFSAQGLHRLNPIRKICTKTPQKQSRGGGFPSCCNFVEFPASFVNTITNWSFPLLFF